MLTGGAIVADGEVRSNVTAGIGKSIGTVLCIAADAGGCLPDDLRKVSPVLKV